MTSCLKHCCLSAAWNAMLPTLALYDSITAFASRKWLRECIQNG